LDDEVRFTDLKRSNHPPQRKKLGAGVHTSEWIPWHRPGDPTPIEESKRLRTIDLLIARAFGRRRPPVEEVVG